MAERVGFEPTIPVKVCPLSRRIVSTTHAPLRIGTIKLFAVISWTARSVLRCAQDFACGLPLRSRPQPGSNFNHSRTSPRWDNQVVCRNLVDGAFGPSLRSGFRLRAPAALTPATLAQFQLLTHLSALGQSSCLP